MEIRTPAGLLKILLSALGALQGASRFSVTETRGRLPMFSAGVPVVLLHGVGEGEGYTDEIITFALLVGLVLGLVFLAFRGTRNKNKRRPRPRRGRKR